MDVIRVMKYFFAFPYLGGILVVASFFFPVASFFNPNWFGDSSYSIWMWGLLGTVIWKFHGTWYWDTEYSIIPYIPMFIFGLICCLLIIFFAVKTVLAARKIGDEEKFLDDIKFVKYSGVIIAITIIWMILVEIIYNIYGFIDYPPVFSFWGQFNMQFGVIGIFLGASLPIIGFVLTKIFYKRYYYLFYEEEEEEE